MIATQPTLAFTSAGAKHATCTWRDPLDRNEWIVRPVPHATAVSLIQEHHYAHGGPNTSVAALGLYHRDGDQLFGAALWLPPIITAARRANPNGPHAVLALSRLACVPDAPKNAASFLIANGIRLLPDRYRTLLTFADEAQGHLGGIYQATNWAYAGATAPRAVWRRGERLVSPKRGPRTLTARQMLDEGCVLIARSRKHRYVMHRGMPAAQRPMYPKAAGIEAIP